MSQSKNKTRGNLKQPSGTLSLVTLAVMTVLLLLTVFLVSGCRISRSEIEAAVWLNNAPLPQDVCRGPAKDYGFYRRLNDGRLEFVSFCRPEAKNWIAIHKDDLQKILDRLSENQGENR